MRCFIGVGVSCENKEYAVPFAFLKTQFWSEVYTNSSWARMSWSFLAFKDFSKKSFFFHSGMIVQHTSLINKQIFVYFGFSLTHTGSDIPR